MKITELLIEDKQLQEGPMLNKIGSAVGKTVGTIGKGLGATVGGAVGLGKAVKKGYQAGKSVVGMGGDTADSGNAATPTAAAPSSTTPPSTTAINQAGPQGAPQAKPVQGTAAKQAVAKTTVATAQQNPTQAGQTMYAQVKANIDKLDKKGKQRILALLQKSLQAAPAAAPTQPATAAAPTQPATAAAPPATPAGKKPVKIASRKKVAPAPGMQTQTAGYVHNGKLIAEGFSLFRKS